MAYLTGREHLLLQMEVCMSDNLKTVNTKDNEHLPFQMEINMSDNGKMIKRKDKEH